MPERLRWPSPRKKKDCSRAVVSPLLMCQTCGGDTERFASGWRSVLPEGGAKTISDSRMSRMQDERRPHGAVT